LGSGGGAGVLGAGSGGSAAFGAGGNLGAAGTTGASGSGGFGGTLDGGGFGGTGTGGISGATGTGGASGSAGTAGAAGTGGSGGMPLEKPCMAAVADAGTGVVKVQMRNNEDPSPTNNEIKPILNLTNLTSAAIPLTELKVRYWYTKDNSDSTQILECDYAMIGNTNIDTGNDLAFAVEAGKPGANWYFELRFLGGSLPANGQTGDIKLRLHTGGFQNFSEVDDYSYCQASSYTDWDHVTVYRGTNLIWGVEP
jgi:cellulose 1,4-beta-cellobiosidase